MFKSTHGYRTDSVYSERRVAHSVIQAVTANVLNAAVVMPILANLLAAAVVIAIESQRNGSPLGAELLRLLVAVPVWVIGVQQHLSWSNRKARISDPDACIVPSIVLFAVIQLLWAFMATVLMSVQFGYVGTGINVGVFIVFALMTNDAWNRKGESPAILVLMLAVLIGIFMQYIVNAI